LGINYVKYALDISDDQAGALLIEMEKQGLIEPQKVKEETRWVNTLKGNSLALAKANKPLLRKTADRIMTELMERITRVNNDPYFLYKVNKIIIFGSYLTDSLTMNDIDIAIDLVPKEVNHEMHITLREQRSQFLAENGKHFRHYTEYLAASEVEIYVTLRANSRHLSFHSINDKILEIAQQKVININ
jgi:predicted nucleotidyltransferase